MDSSNSSKSPKSVSLTVKIEFTLTYPKSPPIVTIPKYEGLTAIQVRKIKSAISLFNKDVNNRDRELAFDILSLIQDNLNDFATDKNDSLEEERQKRLEEEARLKKEKEEELQRKRKEDELISRNNHLRLLEDEIKRFQDESGRREQPESPAKQKIKVPDKISDDTKATHKFDRTITARVEGTTYRFNEVYEITPTSINFFGNHYIVKPNINNCTEEAKPVFLLTIIDLNEPFWMLSAGKKLIGVLEKDLEIVRHINHPNVVSLYEFKIVHTETDGWRIYLLTEYSPSCYTSLSDLLDTVETVSVKVAKNWTSNILDGLECIHKHGIAHKFVNLENIYIVRNNSTRDSVIKLNRVCFGHLLGKMNANHPFSSNSMAMPGRTWEPPEMERPNAEPVMKSDVYDFGTVLCQLLSGKDIVKSFRSPRAFISSPQAFSSLGDSDLYDALISFLQHTFDPSPKKRYSVLELLTSKFIRDHDTGPAMSVISPTSTPDPRIFHLRKISTSGHRHRSTTSSGQFSVSQRLALSRYETDFSEVQILGRGAYGEVVKARHRLEGQFYAIKKIRSSMDKVEKLLGEIQLLSRLSHSHIVRYYSAWLEEDATTFSDNAISDSEDEERSDFVNSESSTHPSISGSNMQSFSRSQPFSSPGSHLEHSYSTPLDSQGGPDIVFDYSSSDTETEERSSDESESEEDESTEEEDSDSDDDSTEEEAESESDNQGSFGFSFGYSEEKGDLKSRNKQRFNNTKKRLQKPESSGSSSSDSESSVFSPNTSKPNSRGKKRSQACTIFIQMEYCENHTLADLIKDGLNSRPDEYWRLFRQIIDALDYIHTNGIIHRDLKPVNIFIDQAENVKIGDFGLAKVVGQNVATPSSVTDSAEELTQEVGTGLYIAPEVLSAGGGVYGSKVDMYSLGIIFFEMIFPMETAMERVTILRGIRNIHIRFPKEFLTQQYTKEYQIVSQLIDHDPNKRPSAKELQKSPLIPTPHEDEIVEKTLQKIFNVRGDSRLISQVCNVIFSKELDTIPAILYDRGIFHGTKLPDYILMQRLTSTIFKVFQYHGAIKNNDRPTIFPTPSIYEYSNIAKFIDKFGTILQLPYDLTFPFARKLAQEPTATRKSFVFGNVYREREDTLNKSTEPRKCSEISFDIVNNIKDPLHNEGIDDAETIKVLEEIVSLLPAFNKESVVIVLNHSDILDSILKFCSIPQSQFSSALMLLGQFGKSPATPSAKAKFLDQPNMTSSTLTDLELFGFEVGLETSESRILGLMHDSEPSDRFYKAILYLRKVEHQLRVMGVTLPIAHVPLSHYNHKFYKSGIMFQVILQEKKEKRRMLLAAGGRYNSLINTIRTNMGVEPQDFVAGAVGFNMQLDLIFKCMKNYIEARMNKKTKSEEKSKHKDLGDIIPWIEPRCDVLVCTSKVSKNKDNCLELLKMLWSASIKADYILQTRQSDQIALAEAENVPFIVCLRQPSASASKNFKPVRIISLPSKDNMDLALEDVIPKLVALIRGREAELITMIRNKETKAKSFKGIGPRGVIFSSYASGSVPVEYLSSNSGANIGFGSTASGGSGRAAESDEQTSFANVNNLANGAKKVKVLSEGKLKGGKKNKWKIEQEAIASITEFKNDLNISEAYYSLDVKDDVLNAILTASLDSVDDWKRKVVPLSLTQKAYLLETQAKLANEVTRGTKYIYLYSSKTRRTVVYSVN